MKVRTSFVSNSSTSSFLIYGSLITSEEYEEIGYDDLKNLDIDSHSGEYGEYYLGASWDMVGDDETGAQFKERIKKQIEEIVGHPVECSTYEEAWYNG